MTLYGVGAPLKARYPRYAQTPPTSIRSASEAKPNVLAHTVSRSIVAITRCCSDARFASLGSRMTTSSSRIPTSDFHAITAMNATVTTAQRIRSKVKPDILVALQLSGQDYSPELLEVKSGLELSRQAACPSAPLPAQRPWIPDSAIHSMGQGDRPERSRRIHKLNRAYKIFRFREPALLSQHRIYRSGWRRDALRRVCDRRLLRRNVRWRRLAASARAPAPRNRRSSVR